MAVLIQNNSLYISLEVAFLTSSKVHLEIRTSLRRWEGNLTTLKPSTDVHIKR